MIPTNAVWFGVRLSCQDTSGAWFMPETEALPIHCLCGPGVSV